MRKRLAFVFGALALIAFIGLSSSKIQAIVVPTGPAANGQAITGNGSDGTICRWSTYYGQPAVVNSGFITESASGVTITGTSVINGSSGVGSVTPSSSVQLLVTALNASTTGQITNAATSATADIAEFEVNGSTKAVIGPTGMLGIPILTITKVDTTVPDHIGSLIEVVNMTSAVFFPGGYGVCVATGALAAQYSVVGGTHGVNMNGCGSGQ